MMRAMDSLRQRMPHKIGQSLGYSPVRHSDDEDEDSDGYELRDAGEGSLGQGVEGWQEGMRGRPPRGDGDNLWPHYTPIYSNEKVQRRKQLDATVSQGQAGLCVKLTFVVSLWGVLFLSWVGATLASGGPYMLERETAEEKLALSRSVFGAAAMYFVCGCLSGFSWYRSSFGVRPAPTLGYVPSSSCESLQ